MASVATLAVFALEEAKFAPARGQRERGGARGRGEAEDGEPAPHARSRSSSRPASRQTLTSIHSAMRIAGATSSA